MSPIGFQSLERSWEGPLGLEFALDRKHAKTVRNRAANAQLGWRGDALVSAHTGHHVWVDIQMARHGCSEMV